MITSNQAEQANYLPARMINEFVYCPRLFYYEYVESLFADNQETVEGSIAHKHVDEKEEELLSIEGNAARVYFQNFAGMIKSEEEPFGGTDVNSSFKTFDFSKRNRRPPRDPVNALLSLAYSMLAKDLTIVAQAVGLDPYLGFYHQPRFGRASLALDLMEPFRPLIADSAVLSAINTRMVTDKDFVRAGNAVALTPNGRKAFFRAYEKRMDTLVTHPLFGYRVNYRRMLEIQTRLLARVLTGEILEYPVFTTR
ncbi:MAG: CRISPR-associated endonuclease Cas1 [Blastopirellula sp.]|nr:MAG: CRISPR-associated endonuclease Cas1 [Blastopirellula sp.]